MIDSGAALRACRSTAARVSLERYRLIAPPLLWSEITSFLSEAAWRREVTRPLARTWLDAFDAFPVERRSPAALYREAWDLADELGWAKTYDAEFLALARIDGCQVATTDARLLRGAARTGLVVDAGSLTTGGAS